MKCSYNLTRRAMLLAMGVVLTLSPVAAAQESRQAHTPDGAYHVDPFNSHVSSGALTGALDIDPTSVSSLSSGTSDHNGFDAFSTAASGFPTAGSDYVVLTSGCTSVALQPNTSGGTTCVLNGLNNSQGNDLVQLDVTLNVPAGAKSWLIDSKFFSEEFPEYVGSSFNDAFLIEQGSSNFTISGNQVNAPNNVAFDANGDRISINTTGALGMTAADAAGTTYDGATKTLTTHAPIPEDATTIRLIFSVMDLGDSILDTAVFLDNFRFSGSEVGQPVTQPATNTPPTANAGPDVSGDEGAEIALDGTVSDVDGDAVTTTWSYTPGADVDAGASCSFGDPNAVDTSISCTDDGTYTLTLTADDGQSTSSDSAVVSVANKAPDVSITAPAAGALYAVGASVELTAPLTDAGANDTHTCQVSWGDGTTSPSAAECGASHAFTAAGVYNIEVTATDDDGAPGSANVMVVVYDPSAGFVTGGGWINSPPGAYPADATLTGKANFGFVSKYQKGATTPSGATEFQFHVASFNFQSESYEWLVVSGPRAQYKGKGKVNGESGYGFLLTATDGAISGGGGTDKFRIKIWSLATGAIVYDNMVGNSDDLSNAQEIGGGSIVIHAKK